MRICWTVLWIGLIAAGAWADAGDLLATFENPSTSTHNDQFPSSVVSLGDDVVIGAWGEGQYGASNGGVAYLFSGQTGNLLQTFENPTPDENDMFGYSVGTLDGKVLVGSPWDDTGATNAGIVHLFDASNGNILQSFQKSSPGAYEYFGHAIAGVGSNVLIGAPEDGTWADKAGAAYLFDQSGTQLHSFENPTPASYDFFGGSLAGVGSNVLIGARGDNTTAYHAGAAYLFNGSTGALMQTFHNPDPDDFDEFGYAIAAVGTDRILIGAPYDDTAGDDAGAVYLFDVNTGNLLETYYSPNAQAYDYFGSSVAAMADGASLMMGAPNDDTGALNAGAVYVFQSVGQTIVLQSPDPRKNDYFGKAVAGSGAYRGIVAASREAYLYDVPDPLRMTLQLVSVEDPQGNIPSDYVCYDVVAEVHRDLLSMQMVVHMDELGDIYQDQAGDDLAPDPGLFGQHPSLEFDTYLTMPVGHSIVGAALDIEPGSSMVFDAQNLNIAWQADAGQQSGAGVFQVARITVHRRTNGSFSLAGEQTDDLPPAVLEGTFEAVYHPMTIMMTQVDDPDVPEGYTAYDFLAVADTNLAAFELILDASQPDSIYQHEFGSAYTEPMPAMIATYPELEFDTYVTLGAWGYPSPTNVISGAVDILRGSTILFDDQHINISWVISDGSYKSGPGVFRVARITLANNASAEWTIMGWQTGDEFGVVTLTGSMLVRGDVDGNGFVGADDLVTILTYWGQTEMTRQQGDITGDGFIGADDYVEVLTYWGNGTAPPEPAPEPATLGLILAGGLALLRRRG